MHTTRLAMAIEENSDFIMEVITLEKWFMLREWGELT